MSVTVIRDNTASVLRALERMTKDQVLVGIPESSDERQPEPDDTDGLNNAEIGYLMENGSPAANIPARPHLIPGVASVDAQIAARYKAGAKAVLDGTQSDLTATHTAVGFVAENAVKRKITQGPFTPLADSTLAERRRRGRTGEKPLIDTGQYRRAITHVIRPKGKR